MAPVVGPPEFQVIVAATTLMAIGKQGRLPWQLKGDMAYFKRVTVGDGRNGCIMGRKTWESIPPKFRPLKGRKNVVLSSSPKSVEGVQVCPDLNSALEYLEDCGEIFVVGGAGVYDEAVRDRRCKRVYLTSIQKEFPDCDTFFPTLQARDFRLASRSDVRVEGDVEYRYEVYERIDDDECVVVVEKKPPPYQQQQQRVPLSRLKEDVGPHEEEQYLNLIRKILKEGVKRNDRTGTGTKSIFGAQMRFSLRENKFPLVTTKRVFWRGVAEELLWFIKGSTDATELSKKQVKIWDDNGSRDFLDKRGLHHRAVGDLGPVYGFQWRHFGAKYQDKDADYSAKGVDQLRQCIDLIQRDPTSRRIVMTAWNPVDLDAMALPPCHLLCQFYVSNGELSLHMYQRSADMGLGVPFNVASYALLARLVAHVTGLEPGDFVHTIGDAHVYCNHVDALDLQLQRTPKPFPTLTINQDKKHIDDFLFDDFTLTGYEPHGKIHMKMAV